MDGRQNTTCSYLTGTSHQPESVSRVKDLRYFDNRSFVRLIINLDTRPPSSFNLTSLSSLSFSDASASRPFRILDSKFFLKSSLDPRYSGLAKLSRAKYSDKSFCIGVPVRMTLLWTLRAVRAWKVSVSIHQLRPDNGRRMTAYRHF